MDAASRFLINLVHRHKTPSVQYAIFDQEGLIYRFMDGWADIAGQKEVEEDTIYHIFSITKTFTATGILKLVSCGKIRLDDRVSDYLPDFPYPGHVSVRHLLAHSSGIPNPIPLRWIRLADSVEPFDQKEFFKGIFAKYPKLRFEPGHKFSYSNLGYVFLGELIEKVSGLPYQDFIRAEILNPLEIHPHDMSFQIENPNRRAKGYHKRGTFSSIVLGFLLDKPKFMGPAEGPWVPFHPILINGMAYGGLFGTVNGLMKYLNAFLNNREILLNKQHLNMMLTEQNTASGKPSGMALSWFTGHLNGRRYFAHAGGGGGNYGEIRFYPDLGTGSIVYFNRSGMSDARFLDKVDRFFLK